jgi:tRNA (guanine37-N1)-methyltransferase
MIRRWRLKQSLGRTWLRRPDLLARVTLDEQARGLLEEFRREWLAAGETQPTTVASHQEPRAGTAPER